MAMIDTPKRRYALERLSQWQQQAFAHRSRRLAESEPLLRLLALRRSEVCQAETSELKGPTCWSTGRSLSGREFASRRLIRAVLMLITSSNVVGCTTGRSAGLAPLNMLRPSTQSRSCKPV